MFPEAFLKLRARVHSFMDVKLEMNFYCFRCSFIQFSDQGICMLHVQESCQKAVIYRPCDSGYGLLHEAAGSGWSSSLCLGLP